METSVLTIPPPVTDLVLVVNCDLDVVIDIKPGSETNPVNVKSKGVIPVAILTTADFDATSVDHTTVVFDGVSECHLKNAPSTGCLPQADYGITQSPVKKWTQRR